MGLWCRWSRATGRSAAGALDPVTECCQGGDHGVAVVALNLDHPLAQVAAGRAPLLELFGELTQGRLCQQQAGDGGDGLAATAGGLAAHPGDAVAGLWGGGGRRRGPYAAVLGAVHQPALVVHGATSSTI